MTNQEKYKMLASGIGGRASSMAVVPGRGDMEFSPELFRGRLNEAEDLTLLGLEINDGIDCADMALNVIVEYSDTVYELDVAIIDADPELDGFYSANYIDDTEMDALARRRKWVFTSMFFNSDTIVSFHVQIKVLMALVPDAAVIVDYAANVLLSGRWGFMVSRSQVPPSPRSLYSVHRVYNEDIDGNRTYWIHTHGLSRCNSVELEVINSGVLNDMILMSADKFALETVPERKKFAIAYDDSGINLAWIRWEEAIKLYPEDVLGGELDRRGSDDDYYDPHCEPSGVLFAVTDEGGFVSTDIYSEAFDHDLLYFVSETETERMSAAARERYPFFKTVFDMKGEKDYISAPETGDNGATWSFMVKLGLPVGRDDDGREHLWFEVLSLANEAIEGRMMNQPHLIGGINEGDVMVYTTDYLTDWIIHSPDAVYTPDTIYQLIY